jgi:hypothetical protein
MTFLELCLSVGIIKTCSFNTKSHFTFTELDENFLSQPWLYTCDTSAASQMG